MDHKITFKKGGVYYHAAFCDRELKIPAIDTYIYCGIEEGKFLFADPEVYLRESGASVTDRAHYLSIPFDYKGAMLDQASLVEWLQREHASTKPGKPYVYNAA